MPEIQFFVPGLPRLGGCMGAESREHMMAVYLARRHGFVRGDWRGRA